MKHINVSRSGSIASIQPEEIEDAPDTETPFPVKVKMTGSCRNLEVKQLFKLDVKPVGVNLPDLFRGANPCPCGEEGGACLSLRHSHMNATLDQ